MHAFIAVIFQIDGFRNSKTVMTHRLFHCGTCAKNIWCADMLYIVLATENDMCSIINHVYKYNRPCCGTDSSGSVVTLTHRLCFFCPSHVIVISLTWYSVPGCKSCRLTVCRSPSSLHALDCRIPACLSRIMYRWGWHAPDERLGVDHFRVMLWNTTRRCG